jgi:rhamnulokinase
VALQKEAPDQLQQADKLLFIPDYLHFLLSGKTSCEYTEASTSGLLSAEKKDWDRELIEILGLPQHIFAPLTMPGTILAPLSRKISEEVGFQAEIVLPATHDTGSAVLAMPTTEKNSVFLSSGTWSLFGCEREHPDTQSQSMHCNFTNEGGYNQTIRYLKNIMGLWMLQSIRRESALSFDEMMKLATQNLSTPIRVDVNDPAFLAPASMTEALRQKIGNMDLSTGELIAIVYLSLADAYKKAADELEGITKKPVSSLHILGGGGKDELLNQLTANALGKPIFVGPTEATSVGNLVAQLLGTGAFSDVAEARTCVRQSFPIASYLPSPILP